MAFRMYNTNITDISAPNSDKEQQPKKKTKIPEEKPLKSSGLIQHGKLLLYEPEQDIDVTMDNRNFDKDSEKSCLVIDPDTGQWKLMPETKALQLVSSD